MRLVPAFHIFDVSSSNGFQKHFAVKQSSILHYMYVPCCLIRIFGKNGSEEGKGSGGVAELLAS